METKRINIDEFRPEPIPTSAPPTLATQTKTAQGEEVPLLWQPFDSQWDMVTNFDFYYQSSNGIMLSKGKALADARVLAREYADSMRGNKNNKNKAAVIVTLEGDIIYGLNGEGVYNSKVQEVLDFNGRVNKFNRQCAEVNAISKALNKGYDLTCATIAVVKIGGINSTGHGLPKPPCNVCAGLILYYGMIYISF